MIMTPTRFQAEQRVPGGAAGPSPPERRHGWGATIATLVLLVSRVFGMPRSTVHRIVDRVTEEVVAIRHGVIYLPKTADDLAAVTQGFAGLARHRAFLKAAGAIDGCHVRIKPPSGPDGQCYRNRKLFASIILQAVCDHQGRFIDTYVGWPGSVHDSRVQGTQPTVQACHLPSSRVLHLGRRARSIIERAFGMMKTRFRAIFLQALEVHHTFVPQVITACAILHNICLGAGDIMAPEDEMQDDMPEDEGENGLEAPSQGFPPSPPPSTPTTPDSPDSDGSSSWPAPAADVQTGPPCKGIHDETDSVLSAVFLNTVRAVVSTLLLYVLARYRKEICNGCQISHPSQCQHECLEETPDYFYEVHHSQLMERLWTGRFIPTIQRALNARRLCVSEYRIRGACDFLLHDFKTMRCIDHSIAKIYNTMTEGDEEKIEIVDRALEFWLIE
ncbi:hypothetical protein ABVT39_020322 [Epinephelus coioides]